MSATTSKRKRAAPAQAPVSTTQSSVISSVLDCFDFLAHNEYSEKTIGIQAFVTRKSVGDINFSDLIDDSEKRNRQGQQNSFISILEDKRQNLAEIEASVEKCLMLTRLISYIKENEARFTSLISDIRLDIQYKMTDDQTAQPSTCDFRKREQDFHSRRTAQELRRLFYHTHDELKQPPNLIYLQNRVTDHLIYTITQLTHDSKSRQTYLTELENIFRTSFMIVAQPHSGVIPVTIYERRGPGEYTAKVSVIIISLLHDFMEAYPNLIELYDIEPSLCPSSTYYKLEEPRSLSWKTCQLQTTPGGKSRTFMYAEVSVISIEQSSKTDTRVRFAQLMHSFKFAIKLQLNFANSKMAPVFQFALESLPFGIGAHNSQIPQLLTRIILDDIRRFSKIQPPDIKFIQNCMQRYFIHRTGVQPNDCVNICLEQELIRASSIEQPLLSSFRHVDILDQRSSYQTLEDIYLDFLASFVCQVEFMAKHPLLSMFHADGLFLGICNSERAAEAIVQSSIAGSPVIGLRFNAIRIDYTAISTATGSNRAVKLSPCAVRVDIYNDRTKKLQNRTFDSSILANDVSKFVSTAHTENAGRIRILSSFDDRVNAKKHLSFSEFAKYYHERLQKITKNDEKYKLVTDLVENANDGNTEDDIPDNQSQYTDDMFFPSLNSIDSLPPLTPHMFENEQSSDATSIHEYSSVPYDASNYNVTSPTSIQSPSDRSQQQLQSPSQTPYVNNQEAALQYILSNPHIADQIMRQYGINNGGASVGPPQQPQMQQFQPQLVTYQQQQTATPIPPQQNRTQIFQQPYPTQISQQRQLVYQQVPMQTSFPQPQFYQTGTMQFQMPIPQQQQLYLGQQQTQMQIPHPRQAPSSVIHHLPNGTIRSPLPTQQSQHFPANTSEDMSQQCINQIGQWSLMDGDLNQVDTNFIEQQRTTTDQTSLTFTDQEIQQMVDDLLNPKSTDVNN